MSGKIIKKGSEAQSKIIDGVVAAANAIKTTLGPSGKCVAISNASMALEPEITRDGATVAKSISFSDPAKNMGAALLRKAASLTESEAGDGPQPLYAKVLTPTGWTTMGSLKIGDEICGTDGTIQTVIGTYAKGEKEIYKLTFSNGQVVECCEDHLWDVTTRSGVYKTLTLKEILKEGVIYNKPCGEIQYNFFTPRTFVEFKETSNLPVDPFLVGLLIGDGSLCDTGSIELSLALNKIDVMDEVNLPENIKFSIKKYEDKHYYRVKFSKIDPSGLSMFDYVDQIGLLNKKSSDKFIPKNYLYSSKENRERLLAGLTNTDGYINPKGLLEYSTISDQLCKDVVELLQSLGKAVYWYKKDDRGKDCYSTTPVFRISELKGYKYGTKLVGIEKTGEYTEMMCIKVSNPNSLYITNDYIVTHNTSTTSVLIKEFCEKGQKILTRGANINEVKSGMLKASEWIKNYISTKAIAIDGDMEKIRKVATISANNDPEVGNLIVECMEQVGTHGIITADLSASLDTVINVTTGMKLDRGWMSPQYVTSQTNGLCELENPAILVVGERLSSVQQILTLVGPQAQAGRPILIICEEIDDIVNATIAYNTQIGAMRACVVKGIDFGDSRKNIMQDIATMVGGEYVCQENNLALASCDETVFGSANRVVISKDSTVIYEGQGDPAKIQTRVDILQARIDDPTTSAYDKNKFAKRIASLTGGVGIIKAGGATEAEKLNRKATIEDAILASKSALAEGCVPGSGYIYYKASLDIMKDKAFWKTLSGDEQYGVEIVVSSLPGIMRTVVDNATSDRGICVLEAVGASKKENWGFNAKTKDYCDLLEAGVLDSAKVIRVALENAVSTAAMVLLTDCTIIDEPEDDTNGCGCGCHCH